MKENMDFVYTVLICVGIVIPILNIFIGGIGDVFHIDFDMDGDTNFDCPVPFNVSCLFFSCAVVGAVGHGMNVFFNVWLAFVIALAAGLMGYMALYRLVVLPLKKNDATATTVKDMLGEVGEVTKAIPYQAIGEAKFIDKTGCCITYMVRYNDTDFPRQDKIPVGAKVSVIGIEEGTLLVCLAPS